MNRSGAWQDRFDRTLLVVLWGASAVAAVLTMAAHGMGARTLVAGALQLSYMVALQAFVARPASRAIWPLSGWGVAAGVTAALLTGASSSPYVLVLIGPIYAAAIRGGVVMGTTVTVAAMVGLTGADVLTGTPLPSSSLVQAVLLYALVDFTFSEARRILIEEQRRTDEMERLTLLDEERLHRLEASHDLLSSLSALATSSELNPVSVGRAALRDLAQHVDFDAAEITFLHPSEVVVARRGDPGPAAEAERHPVRLGDRHLGTLTLWSADDSPEARARRSQIVETMLRPVALAFDNIALLRDIAGRAVQQERLRLARELHDEIGPSVASLGLGLDLLSMQPDLPPDERTEQLEMLRKTASRIVEDIRSTVEDLRSARSSSLVECAQAVASEIGADGPSVSIELDEQRPPRDRLAADLSAILTEAIRNAAEHAGASRIVVSGEVDRDRGRFVVADDGRGFTVAAVSPGHWGLVGMRERAARLGAALDIASGPDGTTVALSWGTAP